MHLTCSDCGTVRNEPFCPQCYAKEGSNARAVGPVGRCSEPELVEDFFASGCGITKGPTKWAQGALRFSKGWDSKASFANSTDQFYVDSFGDLVQGHAGGGVTSRSVHYGSDE